MIECSCCGSNQPCTAQISIFQQLDQTSQEEISNIAIHGEIKKGEMLFTPNDNHGLYLISKGRVKVYEITSSGKEYLLQVLQKGDFVGEEALFSTEQTYTYGEALSDGRVCFIDREAFLDLLTKHPSISLKLLEEFSKRMRHNAHQTATNAEPVQARLAEYLLNLSAAQDSDRFEIPLQLKELSSYLSTTPETLSRKLRELEREQIIKRERRMITLLQKQKLERYIIL